MFDPSKLPLELRSVPRFQVWKYSADGMKVPYDPVTYRPAFLKGTARDQSWHPLEVAITALDRYSGVSRDLLPGTDIGVDLDGCVLKPSRELDPAFQDVYNFLISLGTYSEYSPSTFDDQKDRGGLKFFFVGRAPQEPDPNVPGGMINRFINVVSKGLGDHVAVEIHARTRFYTVTAVPGPDSKDELRRLTPEEVTELYKRARAWGKTAVETAAQTSTAKFFHPLRGARRDLVFQGKWQDLYPSSSEAVGVLVNTLVIEHGGDLEAAERELLTSPLMATRRGSSNLLWSEDWRRLRVPELERARLNAVAYLAYLAQQQAKKKEPPAPIRKFQLGGFMKQNIKEREVLLRTQRNREPLIYAQSINQVFSWRGLGKTMFSIGLASAMAAGDKFLAWEATRPIKVLYIEGEMPAKQLQDRFKLLAKPAAYENLELVTLDYQVDNYLPSLSTEEGRQRVEESAAGFELIVIDSISTMANISTNEEEFWLDIQAWLRKLRSQGLAIIFLHHAGKGGLQRGHSRSEDQLDLSIKLSRPDDYQVPDGLRCLLEFDKTRGVHLKDGGRLEIKFTELDGWLWSYLEDDARRAVTQRFTDDPDFSSKKLAEELGISQSLVNRYRREELKASRSTADDQLF